MNSSPLLNHILVKSASLAVLVFALFVGWFRWVTHIPRPALTEAEQRVIDSALALSGDTLWWWGSARLRHTPYDLWELYLEGDPVRRGAAHGRLMKPLLRYQEHAFLDFLHTIIPSTGYLKFLRYVVAFFNRRLPEYVLPEFQKEFLALSYFHADTFDFVGSKFERVLHYHAAHDVGHALQNYMLVGCSSFAVWDSFSSDGRLLVGRNFDFFAGEAFARHRVVQFVKPDSGYRFISVVWPGFCGVVSGLNEKGLSVTINASASRPPLSAKTPISLLTREILQYAGNLDEALRIARKRRTFVSESILVCSGPENRAFIIEKTPYATAVFRSPMPRLICTNHFQSDSLKNDTYHQKHVISPDSPFRWATIQKALEQMGPCTPAAAAAILRRRTGPSGEDLGLGNPMALNQLLGHHAVVIQPGSRTLWVASPPYQLGTFVCYQLDSAFARIERNFCGPWSVEEQNIPADTFQKSLAFRLLPIYRKLENITRWFAQRPKVARLLPDTVVRLLTLYNPHYFGAHKATGDYYKACGRTVEATRAYKNALRCAVPDKRLALQIREALQELEMTKNASPW
ncbi:MAG: C45 family peptidase [Flavobacteriales bacterium]|nr:C45 family peptidase [Flavobacteriales bacterium]MCX7767822.1 C45 family peptidase [Flavobacteriales bacterium]MDW8409777.1 C45 family peptidase [Flavobacteriales bacterium]